VVVKAGLPEWLAGGLTMVEPCALLEGIDEFLQVTRGGSALHYQMEVIRHNAIGMKCEVVPQT